MTRAGITLISAAVAGLALFGAPFGPTAPSAASAGQRGGEPGEHSTWIVDDDAPNDPGPGDPLVSDPLENGTAQHPFDAIQEAISAANDSDEIILLDGTYTGSGNRDLSLGGWKTIRSFSGNPTVCIIDCQGSASDPHRGFTLYDGTLRGVTITGAHAEGSGYHDNDGGGIHCEYLSNPTLIDCIITGNYAHDYGGGVYCDTGSAVLSNCTITGNTAYEGGGVCCEYASLPTLMGCTVSNNTATTGGGIAALTWDNDPMLIDCLVYGNTADGGGGIFFGDFCLGTIINTTIRGNSALNGGGFMCCYAEPTLANCTIVDNSVVHNGGGIYCGYYSNVTITHCTIRGNSAGDNGAGIRCDMSDLVLTNCRLGGNAAPQCAGGVDCIRESSITVSNCTFAGNSAATGGGLALDRLYQFGPSTAVVTGTVIWGNGDGLWKHAASMLDVTYSNIEAGTGQSWFGTGCIDVDPQFTQLGHWNDNGTPSDPSDDFWVDGNYRLLATSPSINGGHPALIALPGIRDLDGHSRVLCGRVDMGAYEFGIGDRDCDHAINMVDYAGLQNCFTGAGGGPYDAGCEALDFDYDNDVDLDDMVGFWQVFEAGR